MLGFALLELHGTGPWWQPSFKNRKARAKDPTMKKIPPTLCVLFLVVLALTFTPHILLAQSQITRGVIQGVVVDETGGVIPGARVTLLHTETGFRRELTTDEEGRFTALLMPLGPYKITVE